MHRANGYPTRAAAGRGMIWGEPGATAAILEEGGAVAPPVPYPRVRLVGVGLAASRRPLGPLGPPARAPVASAPTAVPFKRVRVLGAGLVAKVHRLPKRLQESKATAKATARVASDNQARALLRTARAAANDLGPVREVLKAMRNGWHRRRREAQLREDLASFGLLALTPQFEPGRRLEPSLCIR